MERFWSKVDQSGGPGSCWPWIASTNREGYGWFRLGPKMQKAHRVAWFLKHGYWPVNACHECDFPGCCNPDHLWNGTHAENMADSKAKGRQVNKGNRPGYNPKRNEVGQFA